MKTITLKKRKIGINEHTFVIAEADINHNGYLSIAKQLINVAKKAGCDCFKIQTQITEEEMIKSNILPEKISKKPLCKIIKK